jgi:hypothetical protein
VGLKITTPLTLYLSAGQDQLIKEHRGFILKYPKNSKTFVIYHQGLRWLPLCSVFQLVKDVSQSDGLTPARDLMPCPEQEMHIPLVLQILLLGL